MKILFGIVILIFSFNYSIAGKKNKMNSKYTFEVNFPFEQRELNLPAPLITATYEGKVIFQKESYSNPMTSMPAMVSGLESKAETISLHVKEKSGIEKTFPVDLKKGTYLFVYFDLKKKKFNLKQQKDAPGYD